MMDGSKLLRIDSGALLRSAHAFCGGSPSEEELLRWADEVDRLAQMLDRDGASESLHELLRELCDLVDTHPATFAPAAAWAEEKLEEENAPVGDHSLLFLDALASAPERAALDEAAARESGPGAEQLLATLPPELLECADEAIRKARAWKAQVHQLFARAQKEEPGITFAAALEAPPFEEDYVLLCRLHGGELLLTRSRSSLFVDWYGGGKPELFLDGEKLDHRPLPQGEGRRWALPRALPPFTLRLELGAISHSVEIPAEDER